jgi:aerobic-type carbon monoxide dehydrogenase small subunit (CoxS/CutS family)
LQAKVGQASSVEVAGSETIGSVRVGEPIRPGDEAIVLRINGEDRPFTGRSSEPLVWALRDLGLMGTKPGCGVGACGACVVLLDGAPVRSCLMPTGEARAHDILTIEGLGGDGDPNLHPVQRALVDAGAPQCGWCMSGQVLTAVALLDRRPAPTDREIEDAMNDVLCRCGAYGRIRAAVRAVAAAQARSRSSSR